MCIWHKLVENLLVLSTEEGKKRILGVCAVSRQCPLSALEEGSCLSLRWAGPWSTSAGKPQWQGRCRLSPGSCGKGAVPAAREAPPVRGVTGHRRG